MSAREKYQNPPFIEAVCEFRLPPDSKWDLTVPGLIYERVSGTFPNKEQQAIQEIEIKPTVKGLEQQVRTEDRVLFFSSDRKTVIQVGPAVLAINALKPYPSWESFKPRIEEAFAALTGVVNVRGFQRIGLRYINVVEIPGKLVRLEDYFDFYPFLGSNLPQDLAGFLVGCVLPFLGGRDLCRLQISNAVPGRADVNAFLLDLDYYLATPQAVRMTEALDWIENAHQQVESVFEGCLTESLRKIFRGDN
jgi:uncharacterized protein (TIGR04255 family)